MREFNIIISTVKRDKPFVHDLIKSIRKEMPDKIIHLVIGGNDISYLDQYTKGFVKHDIREEEKRFSGIQKASFGFYKCLTLDKTKPALILEDDSLLEEGWSKKLEGYESILEEKGIHAISLHNSLPVCVPNPEVKEQTLQAFQYKGNIVIEKPGAEPHFKPVTWVGGCMFYSLELIQSDIADFVYRFAVNDLAMYDLVVGMYLFRLLIPIYVMVPEIAHNLGNDDSAMGHPEQRYHVDYSSWDWNKYASR